MINTRIGKEKITSRKDNIIITIGEKFSNGNSSIQGGRYILELNGEFVSALNYTILNKQPIISNIYTKPKFRKQGFANILISAIKQKYPKIVVDNHMSKAGATLFKHNIF